MRRSSLRNRLIFSASVSGGRLSANFVVDATSFGLVRFAMVSAKENEGFGALGATTGVIVGLISDKFLYSVSSTVLCQIFRLEHTHF